MSFPPPTSIPPGWYPDPAGSRQWRVWTGERWSEVTRPYGQPATSARFAVSFTLVQALQRVFTLGVVGVLGGLGLLVSVLAHWPGAAHPAPWWFALSASSVAVALLAVGSVVCAFGVKELEGHWSPVAFLPGANLFVASALVTHRLGRRQVWRIASEILLLAVFAVASRNDLWLCLSPVIVAYVETTWFGALIDQLSGPTPSAREDASLG
ncbi:MAG: hypothetical protein JWM55_1855 [Acidimicrobiaceae bacterium]|nr:hypothetical protein [Acidimicrobiaceae bacterium]